MKDNPFSPSPGECRRNNDCPSGLCWDDGRDSTRCIDEGQIAYVDATGCPGRASQNGIKTEPYCEIQKGVNSGLPFVLMQPGAYEPAELTIDRPDVTLVGPWANPGFWADPTPSRSVRDQTAPATIKVGQQFHAMTIAKGKVVIDGLLIQGVADPKGAGGIYAPSLSGRTVLTVRRSVIQKTTVWGIRVGDGGADTSLTVDRCRVTGVVRSSGDMSGATGILVRQGASAAISNSLIDGNALHGVFLDTAALDGAFDHNTIGPHPTAILCNDLNETPFRNSIIFDSNPDTPLSANCTKREPTVIFKIKGMDAGFELSQTDSGAQYRLLRAASNIACCIDKATAPGRDLGPFDYFGARRSQGAAPDIGFHELVAGQ